MKNENEFTGKTELVFESRQIGSPDYYVAPQEDNLDFNEDIIEKNNQKTLSFSRKAMVFILSITITTALVAKTYSSDLSGADLISDNDFTVESLKSSGLVDANTVSIGLNYEIETPTDEEKLKTLNETVTKIVVATEAREEAARLIKEAEEKKALEDAAKEREENIRKANLAKKQTPVINQGGRTEENKPNTYKVVGGKLVCEKTNDKPGKSKENNKGKDHMDMECCLDPDESPNPWCTYTAPNHTKYLAPEHQAKINIKKKK